MVFEQIEKLKQQYTDKYVQVEPGFPELARFEGVTGQVKTVNMSGRALVEFDAYHANIGWYDISLDCLKVVDKPEPAAPESKAKAAPKKPAAAKAAAPAAGKKLSPLEMARQQGAGGAKAAPAAKTEAKKEAAPAAKGKMSVAEMLAAARANKPGGEAKAEAAPAPKADRGKMSVAEMLAAARANKPAAEAPAKEEAAAAPPVAEPEPVSEPEPVEEPVAETPEPDAAPEPAAEPAAAGAVDKSTMSIGEMVAWCREHDAE